jgi:hypothetical protein
MTAPVLAYLTRYFDSLFLFQGALPLARLLQPILYIFIMRVLCTPGPAYSAGHHFSTRGVGENLSPNEFF